MVEVPAPSGNQSPGNTSGDLGGTASVQSGRTASDILAENDAVVEEINSQIAEKLREIERGEEMTRRFERLGLPEQLVELHQDRVDRLRGDVEGLRASIERVQQEVNKQIQDLNNLDDLLAQGDIEGAFMLVQTNRTLSLDRQIAERLKELQARNDEIKNLNDRLAAINKPDKDLEPEERERKVQLRGQIDKLNADSQLDTIKLQSLINKRNQALEMLTNLLQKFQKVLDSIVGNMR